MCKFEFKTYKQKKETVETFEDSVCNECAKAIIQSGIKKVIFLDNKYKNTENNIAARFLFKTAGIETVQYTKSSREVSLSL